MTASSTFTAADGDGYELNMNRWSRRLAVPFLEFSAYLDGEPDGPRSYAALAWAVKGKVPQAARGAS